MPEVQALRSNFLRAEENDLVTAGGNAVFDYSGAGCGVCRLNAACCPHQPVLNRYPLR